MSIGAGGMAWYLACSLEGMRKTMSYLFSSAKTPALLLLATVVALPVFGGPIAPDLRSAASFDLLGGSISNTGTSLVVGNVGATTTITGFPPGIATGTVYTFPSNPTVTLAYNDFVDAFNLALLDPSTQSFSGLSTSQVFLGNNVYTSPLTDVVSTAGISLSFDALGDSSEVFIIKITRDLTINGPIVFNLENGAQASNIFWIVGRTGTIDPVGVPVIWDGDILAGTSFTIASIGPSSDLGGTINGCVFAETANTLAGKTNVNGCSAAVNVAPEPASAWLAALGLLIGACWASRGDRIRSHGLHPAAIPKTGAKS